MTKKQQTLEPAASFIGQNLDGHASIMIATPAAASNLAVASQGDLWIERIVIMTGLRSRILLIVLFSLALAAPAHADKRVALVVGNSAYRSAPLDNPKHDAELIAVTLRSVGFTLVGGGPQIDLDGAKFREAVREFGKKLQDADVGLFYYAGHGVQVHGSNYLVPVDAADVDLDMINADVVLDQMQRAGTGLSIVILDACRTSPSGGRGLVIGRARDNDAVRVREWPAADGLAEMKAPPGTLIAFAAQPGSVAQDGAADGNSPFSAALAEAIRKPGFDLSATFNRVQAEVFDRTRKAQTPYFVAILVPVFYFTPPTQGYSPPTQGYGGSHASPVAPSAVGLDEAAKDAWDRAKDTTSVAVLEDFIRRFGDTFYGTLAREKLEELKKKTQVVAVPPPSVLPSPEPPAPRIGPPQMTFVAPPLVPAAPVGPCGARAATVSLSSRSAAPLSAAEECSLRPRDTFKECANCPEMMVVPAGNFAMGSPLGEKERDTDEGPQHTVTLARPFAVGKFALTFEEWDACVAAGGCNGDKPSDQSWGRGRRPVINVSWDNAKAYVAWLSRTTAKSYRLLSESEFEYASRAGTTTVYPWGDDIDKNNANWGGTQTAPVGSYPPNRFGLYDMSGNVWEWTEDCYHDNYDGAPANGSAWTGGACPKRAYRGGSWSGDRLAYMHSAHRGLGTTEFRAAYLGFRVARTLTVP